MVQTHQYHETTLAKIEVNRQKKRTQVNFLWSSSTRGWVALNSDGASKDGARSYVDVLFVEKMGSRYLCDYSKCVG
jgi:hypothetical protein